MTYLKATPRLKWGYELAPENPGFMKPIEKDIAALDTAVENIMGMKWSLQDGTDYILAQTGKALSREGLRKIVAERDRAGIPVKEIVKVEEPAPDWETNPENYQQNEDGSFILKKDGTPAKKRGKISGYNYHSDTKAKMAVKRSIANKKRKVASLQARVERERYELNKKKEVAQRMDAGDGVANKQPAILDEGQLHSLPPVAKARVEERGVAFRPHEGPQTKFLASNEKDVLYGGAAGGKDESFYRLLST